jgi:hypothetical protein
MKDKLYYDPNAGDGIEGVCYNCLNGGHHICEYKNCKCAVKGHKPWWWVAENKDKISRKIYLVLSFNTEVWKDYEDVTDELMVIDVFENNSIKSGAQLRIVNGLEGINLEAIPELLSAATEALNSLTYAALPNPEDKLRKALQKTKSKNKQ